MKPRAFRPAQAICPKCRKRGMRWVLMLSEGVPQRVECSCGWTGTRAQVSEATGWKSRTGGKAA